MPKRDLVPKPPKSNNHPHHAHRISAAERLWSLTASAGKAGAIGWQTAANDVNAILNDPMWRNFRRYPNTSIRVEPPICVWDGDATDLALMDLVLDDLHSLDPEAYDKALFRSSGKVSLAIIFRCRVPFRHVKTRAYTAHPEYLADLEAARALPQGTAGEATAKRDAIVHVLALLDPQKFEMFGGLSPRHFVVEGRHPDDRDYVFETERTIWNTHRDDVPFIPAAYDAEGRHGELMDRAEAIMQAAGLTVIPEPVRPHGDVVYDLTPETLFVPKGAPAGTLAELTAGMSGDAKNGVRGCLLSTIVSKSGANCTLYVTNSGRVAVADWANDGLMHYMESDKPPKDADISDETRAVLAGMLGKADAGGGSAPGASNAATSSAARRSTRIDDIPRDDDKVKTYTNAAAWLLENVAYYPQAFRGCGGAVSIHPDGEFQSPITIASLRGTMSSFCYKSVGPRGGITNHNPVDLWMERAEQVRVHGVRMRPELPRPLFTEDGLLFINRYFPPFHPTEGGTIEPFFTYLKRLVPDDIERAWVINWFALLVQKPHWRMIALVMVAREMGSGRGLLFECMQYVLGVRFVISIPYAKVSGGAGSRFNIEMVDKLLVCVNEARDSDSRKFSNKNAAGEALKDFVEPNHRVPFRVEPKGVDAYFTLAAMSTWVNSNNVDGLPLGDGDRRAAVVNCGPKATVGEREAFQAWMLDPANIGALHRALRDHVVEQDKAVFDPYDAPLFRGRDLMIEAGKTAIDRAWEAAIEKLATASDLYTQSQVVKLSKHYYQGHLPDADELFRTHNRIKGFRIGVKRPKEINWRVRYPPAKKADGSENLEADNREPVYAVAEKLVTRWTKAELPEIHEQLDKAQKAADDPSKAFNKLLQGVKMGVGGE